MDMASSSSAAAFDIPPHQELYDVFLSFRGEDTRSTFTSHLHTALCQKKIETFIDYKLEKGDKIGPAVLEAIEKSKLWVIIFSKNYASSTWCLDELAHILECKERHGKIAIPIFYGIDPSDVRKQKGSYADAFAQLEQRFKNKKEKVDKWRAALEEATAISGFDNSNKIVWTEADLVEKIVDDILAKLNRKSSCDLRGLVGIDMKIQQIESLLCIASLDVCTVCIWGMGGIGKTTLADAVFHRLSSKFEGCCFLANIREQAETSGGVMDLRNKLLRKILKDEKIDIDTLSIGSTFRQRLSRTKALIVLDDVSDSSQLEVLVGDHLLYAPGSRIIITTRDKGLLEGKVDNDKIYKVEGLSSDDALPLFHLHAFQNMPVTADYIKLSRKVVDYVKGIPLALKTLGPLFRRHKRIEDWEKELDKLKKFPSEKIQNVLKHSYNGLEKNEKEIFLDIACFLKGMDIVSAERIIDTRGFKAVGIQGLIHKSLISISTTNLLEMHDLVQEMGRAIVHEQCIDYPGKRNRLCTNEDVSHVLGNDTGTAATVEFISFDMSKVGDLDVTAGGLKKMSNLRFLIILNRPPMYRIFGPRLLGRLGYPTRDKFLKGLGSFPNALRYVYWEFCPWPYLPSNFSARHLVELRMPHNNEIIGQFWNEDQNLRSLKVLDLCSCLRLTEVPNLSQSPNIEHIDLYGCKRLVQIPSYFQNLGKLTHLNLGRCRRLKNIPDMPGNIQFLNLQGSGIEELPPSVWSHKKISYLDIEYCEFLKNIPSSSCQLKLVSDTFSLKGCKTLGNIPNFLKDITVLNLSDTSIKVLPSSMECLSGLKQFELKSCKSLVTLPTSICKLKSLDRLDLTHCSRFVYFPEILEPMENLKFLILAWTSVEELPWSIGNLIGLQTLSLCGCMELEVVPDSVYNLTNLKTLNFEKCSTLEKLPSVLVGLLSLEVLNLSYGGILKIPDGLVCLTTLRDLDLSRTKIESIPANVKQASQLSRLCLMNCENLLSLPELPLMLTNIEAHSCTSLKRVSSSRTVLTQGWDEYKYFSVLPEKIEFYNCLRLDDNAWSNIMDDAQLRITRVATLCCLKQQQENYDRPPLVMIVCPGNEIPSWFRYPNNDGSSINIKLPSDWFHEGFLGFALSVVVPVPFKYFYPFGNFEIGCKYSFKTNNDESHEIEYPLKDSYNESESYGMWMHTLEYHHVFVWYNAAFELVQSLNKNKKKLVERANSECFPALERVTEASVDFFLVQEDSSPSNPRRWNMEKCGISLLYAQDTEIIKAGKLKAEEEKRK